MRRRDSRLVPVAEFPDASTADDGWAALDESGLAASVVGEPATFGGREVYRIFVAAIDADRAQQILAPIVNR